MDYFAAEDLIVEALTEAFCDEVRVLTAMEMSAIEERRQALPAIYVVPGGGKPTQESGRGRIQEVEQLFYVVVVVGFRGEATSGKLARQKAEQYLETTITALTGRMLKPGMSPLLMQAAPQPVYQNAVAYFPVAFASRTHYKQQF